MENITKSDIGNPRAAEKIVRKNDSTTSRNQNIRNAFDEDSVHEIDENEIGNDFLESKPIHEPKRRGSQRQGIQTEAMMRKSKDRNYARNSVVRSNDDKSPYKYLGGIATIPQDRNNDDESVEEIEDDNDGTLITRSIIVESQRGNEVLNGTNKLISTKSTMTESTDIASADRLFKMGLEKTHQSREIGKTFSSGRKSPIIKEDKFCSVRAKSRSTINFSTSRDSHSLQSDGDSPPKSGRFIIDNNGPYRQRSFLRRYLLNPRSQQSLDGEVDVNDMVHVVPNATLVAKDPSFYGVTVVATRPEKWIEQRRTRVIMVVLCLLLVTVVSLVSTVVVLVRGKDSLNTSMAIPDAASYAFAKQMAEEWLQNDCFYRNYGGNEEYRDMIEERRVLAILYYSTFGDRWVNQAHFLTSKHVCEWNSKYYNEGISCGYRDINDDDVEFIYYEYDDVDLPCEAFLNDFCGDDDDCVDSSYNYYYHDHDHDEHYYEEYDDEESGLDVDDHILSDACMDNPYLNEDVYIKELLFYNNNLKGTIPTELGLLQDLQFIGLDDNFLTGSIPTELGLLKDMQFLGLHYNYITGQIPSEVGMLRNLQLLVLNHNDLTGSIPKSVFEMDGLISLSLSYNFLTGSLRDEIGDMTNLEYLFLKSNDITGTIPLLVGNLHNLLSFELSHNHLSGSIPTEIGNLHRLTSLHLNDNYLHGELPSNLGELQNLALICADRNDLSNTIPSEIGKLTVLRFMDLGYNSIESCIPSEVGMMSELSVLGFYQNNLSCKIPSEIGTIDKLKIFEAANNSLTGTIPNTIGNLSHLWRLVLSSNLLSGTIPSEIGHLLKLNVVKCDNNELSGCLPSELGLLRELDALSLDNNYLECNLPLEIGKLSKLQSFSANNNALSGTIPKEFGNLEDLERLEVCCNSLTGNISADVFYPSSSLNLLRVDGNNFVGDYGSICDAMTDILIKLSCYDETMECNCCKCV